MEEKDTKNTQEEYDSIDTTQIDIDNKMENNDIVNGTNTFKLIFILIIFIFISIVIYFSSKGYFKYLNNLKNGNINNHINYNKSGNQNIVNKKKENNFINKIKKDFKIGKKVDYIIKFLEIDKSTFNSDGYLYVYTMEQIEKEKSIKDTENKPQENNQNISRNSFSNKQDIKEDELIFQPKDSTYYVVDKLNNGDLKCYYCEKNNINFNPLEMKYILRNDYLLLKNITNKTLLDIVGKGRKSLIFSIENFLIYDEFGEPIIENNQYKDDIFFSTFQKILFNIKKS